MGGDVGAAGYDAFARQHVPELELVGCWAHTRRKFVDALAHALKQAALVVHLLKNLCRTEARLRATRAGPKLRALARHLEARPVIDRLRCLLLVWKQRRSFLPQSLMGKAIEYALGQWDLLLPYLTDGRVEPERSGDSLPKAARRASEARQIDTNLIENAIRPTAVGRRIVVHWRSR